MITVTLRSLLLPMEAPWTTAQRPSLIGARAVETPPDLCQRPRVRSRPPVERFRSTGLSMSSTRMGLLDEGVGAAISQLHLLPFSTVCYARSMPSPEHDIREIAQRELRNDISRVLKEVAQGRSLRVTVKGRPVADLVPVSEGRRFVPRAEVERLLREAPLDEAFKRDVDAVLGATIEEL